MGTDKAADIPEDVVNGAAKGLQRRWAVTIRDPRSSAGQGREPRDRCTLCVTLGTQIMAKKRFAMRILLWRVWGFRLSNKKGAFGQLGKWSGCDLRPTVDYAQATINEDRRRPTARALFGNSAGKVDDRTFYRNRASLGTERGNV